MTRIETTLIVGSDGLSANLALPTPLAPGRHAAVVLLEDRPDADDPLAWATRTYGSVTDDTFGRPETLPLEKRQAFE